MLPGKAKPSVIEKLKLIILSVGANIGRHEINRVISLVKIRAQARFDTRVAHFERIVQMTRFGD